MHGYVCKSTRLLEWGKSIWKSEVRGEYSPWHVLGEADWAAVSCCADELFCWGSEMLYQPVWSASTFWKMYGALCFLHYCVVHTGLEGLPSQWQTLEKMQTMCSLRVHWNEAFKVAGFLLLLAFQINNTVL